MELPLIGVFPDGEWDCLGEMLAAESSEFLGQRSLLFGEDESNMFFPFDTLNSNHLQYNISQESGYSSNCSGGQVFIANPPGHVKNCYFSDCDQNIPENTTTCMSMDICKMDEKITVSLNEDGSNDSDDRHMELKRKLDVHEWELPAEDNENSNSSEIQKKKPHVMTRDVQRCKKNAPRPKKNRKIAQDDNEEAEKETNNTGLDGQSSVSSYSSEDDNNASQQNSGKNGKTRASRGSAADPQSLYARKRRERINERLRILQNLVPNGTKVDISTMLEEAVHYVKFLQLQIKLLSSDDLWMYAPIAYNGMDIGLNLSRKISPTS